jgi:hypothetical protein
MISRQILPALLGCFLASNAAALTGTSQSEPHQLASRSPNDTLPIYKDALYCVEDRIEDLIQRMTLPEKAGLFWHGRLIPGPNGTLDVGNSERNSTEFMIGTQLISHFNLVGSVTSARQSAEFHNKVQQYIIDNTRLGIPLSLSTDPRHAFTDNTGTGALAGQFSPSGQRRRVLLPFDLRTLYGPLLQSLGRSTSRLAFVPAYTPKLISGQSLDGHAVLQHSAKTPT